MWIKVRIGSDVFLKRKYTWETLHKSFTLSKRCAKLIVRNNDYYCLNQPKLNEWKLQQ